MTLRALGTISVGVVFLSACASQQQNSSAGAAILPPALRTAASPAKRRVLGCYGTLGVEATPCPVRLRTKNGGSVTVFVSGPQVALSAVIASDCVGPGSVCNVTQTGYLQYDISSIPGKNTCGKAYVVFEGLTAKEAPVGTATAKVINRDC